MIPSLHFLLACPPILAYLPYSFKRSKQLPIKRLLMDWGLYAACISPPTFAFLTVRLPRGYRTVHCLSSLHELQQFSCPPLATGRVFEQPKS